MSNTQRVATIQNYEVALLSCGCGTWYLTLKEEKRIRVFDNRVLRKLFGPKRRGRSRGVEKVA